MPAPVRHVASRQAVPPCASWTSKSWGVLCHRALLPHLKLLHLQALICTALDLPPTYFRRLLQSNAATTVLDFQPMPDDPSVTQVIVDRLNQVRTDCCHD